MREKIYQAWRLIHILSLIILMTIIFESALEFTHAVSARDPVTKASTTSQVKPREAVKSQLAMRAWRALKAQALERSARIASQRASISARRAEVKAIDRWADPKVSYRFSPSPIETKGGPLIHSLMISQKITWGDELSSAVKVAELGVKEAKRGVEEEGLKLIESLERAVWSLWFAEHHRSLLRSEVKVMDSLVSHIEGLVETLARPLSALSRVRYERRLKRERYELSSADIERARLAIGLLLQGGGRFEGSPPAGLINASSKLCHQPQALAQVLAKSASDIEEGSIPTLQRAALRVHQAAVSLDKLRATQRPQLELGLQWSAVNDLSLLGGLRDDVLTAQIGGTIPIWRSANGSARASLVAERARREAALRDRSERWRSSTNELIVTLKDQARQLETLKRELSPLAEETLRQTRHEYEVGLADLSEVYRAELSILALKRDTLTIQFACALSLARWRSLTQSAPTITSAEEVSP